MKMNKQYYDGRIEAMIISKVATLRLDIRDKFRTRHSAEWPELVYTTITAGIRDLRMWQYLAKIIDNHTEPYSVYIAKQLTNDARRNR